MEEASMTAKALLAALAITLLAIVLPVQTQADEKSAQKAVLITGASTGIGRDAAEKLAADGYFVYAGARKAADIEELNKIENIMAVRLDVTRQEEVDAAVELIRKEGRGLWGIVNNAGVNVVAPLIEADISELEFLFDVNVYGVFRVTKAFAPLVIESQGRIVNISSISGFLSGGGYGMYSASKHAVEAFTDSLATEMDTLGVFVAAVEPGNFASEIGLTRCKRRLQDTDAKPYVYFEERRQQMLASCRERIAAGVENEGTPPDAVSAAIKHALFDENPKDKYLVVPQQEEAGWTISQLIEEMLLLNARHEHSYTRDELIEYMDAFWPFAEGEKSFDDEQTDAEMRVFFDNWASRSAASNQGSQSGPVLPAKMSKSDIAGGMFSRPETLTTTEDGRTTLDVTSLLSSDERFASGMYKAEKSRWVIDEPYGVDEFMYFLKGGVTLTSSDGSVTVIKAGEAVTIPKEWTGIWDTDGYEKIWVIYSADGSGL
jgi:NAD(P)-dependent dehydrogenase (short-subunit alcohol dehydrogenase family)/uncharacterized cupin superfamily protein